MSNSQHFFEVNMVLSILSPIREANDAFKMAIPDSNLQQLIVFLACSTLKNVNNPSAGYDDDYATENMYGLIGEQRVFRSFICQEMIQRNMQHLKKVVMNRIRDNLENLRTNRQIPVVAKRALHQESINCLAKPHLSFNAVLRALSRIQFFSDQGYPTFTLVTCSRPGIAALLMRFIDTPNLRHRALQHWGGVNVRYGLPPTEEGSIRVIRAAMCAGLPMTIRGGYEDYHEPNPARWVPLMVVAPLHIIQALARRGYDINVRHPLTGETAFYHAIQDAVDGNGCFEKIRWLFKAGALVNEEILELLERIGFRRPHTAPVAPQLDTLRVCPIARNNQKCITV